MFQDYKVQKSVGPFQAVWVTRKEKRVLNELKECHGFKSLFLAVKHVPEFWNLRAKPVDPATKWPPSKRQKKTHLKNGKKRLIECLGMGIQSRDMKCISVFKCSCSFKRKKLNSKCNAMDISCKSDSSFNSVIKGNQ